MRCSNNSIRLNGLISSVKSLYETSKHIALKMVNKNPLKRHGSPGQTYLIEHSPSLSLSLYLYLSLSISLSLSLSLSLFLVLVYVFEKSSEKQINYLKK